MSCFQIFSRFAIILGFGIVSGMASAQEPCRDIRFPPGASSGLIESEIPPDGMLCYAIAVGSGQRAKASIEGPKAQFPVMMIDGITRDGGDQELTWVTRAGTYEIYVTTLFRYGANTPFRLRLSVTGG